MNKEDNSSCDKYHEENKMEGGKSNKSEGSNLSGQRRHLFNVPFKLNPER